MPSLLAISCILDPATGDALASSYSYKVLDESVVGSLTDVEYVKAMKVGILRVQQQFAKGTVNFTYIYFGRDGVKCI